jgi:uncharacterized membrane protein
MNATLRILFLLALSVWVGEIVFFSFVVAPAVFRNLPVEQAGRTVAVIFPRYYAVGLAAGVVLLASVLGLGALTVTRRSSWFAAAGLVAAMLAMTLYAATVIRPRAEVLRPHLTHGPAPEPAAQAEFDRLHRRAVQLNGLTLLAGLTVLGLGAVALGE